MAFLATIIFLALCGGGFAYYMSVVCTIDSSTLHWHVAQWLPMLFGMTAYTFIGFDAGRSYKYHSAYWVFGRVASAIAAAAVGYVVGRGLFIG